MRIELATEPGDPQRPNEDYASVALPASGQGGTLVLLDGVTPPEGEVGCAHGVPWFTARLDGSLVELSGSRRDMTLAAILAESIRRTADAHRNTCDLSHVRTPQATVVLARWDEERVEHLVLSDSALLLKHADGEVTAVLDDRIDRLVPVVRERGGDLEELRNAEGGFFTAAADPEVVHRALTGVSPRSEVRAVAAMTDGAGRWVEMFHEGSWADCFALLDKEGAQALIDRVRAIEHGDADRQTFRRWKTCDDAAVAYASF